MPAHRKVTYSLPGELCHLLTMSIYIFFAQGGTRAWVSVSFQWSTSRFLEMLSWISARNGDISCCSDSGRDTSTPWAPGSLILPESLDPQAFLLWGWTDSAQQVRRRQQVLHAAFSAYNPQITASALANSPSGGEIGIWRTDTNQNLQPSHLACYLQIADLVFRWLSL